MMVLIAVLQTSMGCLPQHYHCCTFAAAASCCTKSDMYMHPVLSIDIIFCLILRGMPACNCDMLLCHAVVDFPPPRFPSAKPFESSTNARPAAPKQPAAKPPVAKPPAAKPPAKPPVGKRVAKPLQPQPVVTISDDDSEGMPSLVTSDESDNDDSCDRHSRRSPPPQPSKAPEARVTSKQAAKGKQVPSEIVSKGKQVPSEVVSKGKPAPSAAAAVGKQGSAAAPGTPIFKSVSRGYLAQQSSKLALHADATAAAASGSTGPSGSGSDRKEASSGFSFDRAVSGGSKGTVRKVQPSAQAQALLGKHADFFSHYELAADPNDEVRLKATSSNIDVCCF